ncbi:uncharacterized protein FIBRA_07827 [Fibroporia radiculosa]|uniref:NAD(P)-binding domain-containing protein n=1 Tax=Fibroporia radiculosa TaxID=599839 RepID=J4H4U5_9APHY|nr:uncharacterized protein FIBRA_07827 [Fibroporia radiculosa]CCM05599.1 predicted protein [Fibroporia radiculosa]
MPALPANSLIVVTGVTGYIASHIAFAALKDGHRVRGTVRSLASTEEVRAGFVSHGADVSKLSFIVVDDFLSESQLAAAVDGADGVVQVVVPGGVPGTTDGAPQEAIDWAHALLRVSAAQPSVKRFVITSSAFATHLPIPGFMQDRVTDKTWNDAVVQIFQNPPPEMDKEGVAWTGIRYASTKTLSERAVWAWAEQNKPKFDVVSILPDANFGPVLYGGPKSTNAWIPAILTNQAAFTNGYPPQWFVDVRDTGRLHIKALTEPQFGGQRILAASEPYGWNLIFSLLRKNFPKAQVPEDLPAPLGGLATYVMENEVGGKALGGWIGLEQSLIDTGKACGF